MRRLLIATLLAFLLLPLGAAEAGPSQEFKAAGVTWTLPDGWTFAPISQGDKDFGFFARVSAGDASIEAWGYAKGSDGLGLMERAHELMQAGGEGMGSPVATKLLDTTLSGIKGKVVVQKIKADGGGEGHFRKYVMLKDGTFYQLLIRAWHGSHTSHKDAINALRAGFRLLKGAGGEDEPEPLTEVDGESNGGGGMAGGGAEEGNWPEKGPKKEGRKVLLPNHNLEWELPADSPFEWTGAIDNAEAESGLFLIAGARVERKKQEFEKNTPDHNFCRLDLIIQNATPGFKAANWILSGAAKTELVERMKMLDEAHAGKTRTNEEVKFGNHKAAFIKMEGKARDAHRVVMAFCTVLRGKLYLARAICWGHTDTYKQMAPLVGDALGGLTFLETTEPVRGPLLIDTVPDYAGDRGKDGDKEKDYAGPGYVFEKPEGLFSIEARDSMNPNIRFAGEARTEDGKAYFYFEIRTFQMNVSNQPNPEEEEIIQKRAQDWEAGAGEIVDLGSGNKVKMKKASYGRAKGMSYEFTGELNGEPVVEQGWVVKHKSTMLWIKNQFIGQDAEKKLKKLAKDVKKGMKYSR